MKKILIAFLLISGIAGAQNKNKLVMDYVTAHIGMHVGSGDCKALVDSAMVYSGVVLLADTLTIADEINQNILIDSNGLKNQSKILPGDIIMFEGVTMKSGTYIECHTAIVYKIHKDGSYDLAEQGVHANRLQRTKKCKVVVTNMRISNIKSGSYQVMRLK